jgi:hypothetical protein
VNSLRLVGRLAGAAFLVMSGWAPAGAQPIEVVGTRALGMGGAFVAVANDSSATWWNPAAPAAGPFLDVALAWASSAIDDQLPAARTGAWSFALTTPPFGLGYYRLRLTDVPAGSTAQDRADREDRGEGIEVRSLSVSQFGATILQTLVTGVHVGSTVKYVRGTARRSGIPVAEASLSVIPDLLDAGDDLSGGDSHGDVDVDVGVLAVVGGLRVGAVGRNLNAPEFDGIRLPRHARVGVAFDGEAVGRAPFLLSLDVDLHRYDAGAAERQVVAVGGEHWLKRRRIAVRGGARINTVGDTASVVTGGASVSPRAGFFVDGHVAVGGDASDEGWSVAARVSF